jgi:hypothetical protein
MPMQLASVSLAGALKEHMSILPQFIEERNH